MLPEVESIAVFHWDKPVPGDRFHRAEDFGFLRPERLPRTRDESRRIDEMLVAALVDVDFGSRHGFEQEPSSARVIEVDVRDDEGIDVARPKSEPPDRFKDPFRVPRCPCLDNGLVDVVDEVDRPEGLLAEHVDVGKVCLCIERERLKCHWRRWMLRPQMWLCVI